MARADMQMKKNETGVTVLILMEKIGCLTFNMRKIQFVMRKSFLAILIILGLCSCTQDESGITGSIYGVVTVKETAEPMRATGVELYYDGSLLLKTVTYDDGHYEFENLSAGEYELKVVASGYADATYNVIVESGRTARADMQLERLNTHMTVRTLAATEINGDKATLNGTYTYENYVNYHYEPNDVGFVYSTSPIPNNGGTTITSSLTKSFSNVISNLKKGKYYFQAYAKNNIGIEYGEIQSFEIRGEPIVTTLNTTNVAETTATLNGRIEYEGDPAYTERGFVYSSSFPNPTIDDPATATTKVVVSGTSKEFSANIAGLTNNASYYVRAYAKNSDGTVYGTSISFIATSYVPYVIIDATAVQKTDLSTGTTLNAAIDLCKLSRVGGFSDWHLPSLSELTLVYTNKTSIGGFSLDRYWSATYYSGYYFYYIDFNTGSTSTASDGSKYRVRCVRTIK